MSSFDDKYIFRQIDTPEWEAAAELELECFPPNEACKPDMMKRRVFYSPDMFLLAIDRETGTYAAMIDGAATDKTVLTDDFFTEETLHDPAGKNVMILGVMVKPSYQGRGLAREMMRRFAEIQGREGREKLILTCLEGKVSMYAKFGFEDNGWSVSEWGGERWHEMVMELAR